MIPGSQSRLGEEAGKNAYFEQAKIAAQQGRLWHLEEKAFNDPTRSLEGLCQHMDSAYAPIDKEGRDEKTGDTILHYAVDAPDEPKELIDGLDSDDDNADQANMSFGSKACVEFLIKENFLIAPNNKGENILHRAVQKNRLDVLKFLLDESSFSKEIAAMIHAEDHSGLTPLNLAKQINNNAAIQLLSVSTNSEAKDDMAREIVQTAGASSHQGLVAAGSAQPGKPFVVCLDHDYTVCAAHMTNEIENETVAPELTDDAEKNKKLIEEYEEKQWEVARKLPCRGTPQDWIAFFEAVYKGEDVIEITTGSTFEKTLKRYYAEILMIPKEILSKVVFNVWKPLGNEERPKNKNIKIGQALKRNGLSENDYAQAIVVDDTKEITDAARGINCNVIEVPEFGNIQCNLNFDYIKPALVMLAQLKAKSNHTPSKEEKRPGQATAPHVSVAGAGSGAGSSSTHVSPLSGMVLPSLGGAGSFSQQTQSAASAGSASTLTKFSSGGAAPLSDFFMSQASTERLPATLRAIQSAAGAGSLPAPMDLTDSTPVSSAAAQASGGAGASSQGVVASTSSAASAQNASVGRGTKRPREVVVEGPPLPPVSDPIPAGDDQNNKAGDERSAKRHCRR